MNPAPPPSPAPPDAPHPDGRKRWRVGTLSYTQGQLISVFFWLLWGDFCLNIMELVIPLMVPFQLKRLGVSNALIAVLTISLFSVMNFVMNPIISTVSDRHRGPRGRRIPFMLWPTPFLAFFLVLVGFAGNFAAFLLSRFPALGTTLASTFAALARDARPPPTAVQLTVAFLAFFVLAFRFFDLFPGCVYYYVWADVVPPQVMGRFTSLFRVVAAFGQIVFRKYIFGHADAHPQAIYIGCAALYLVAFLLMSLMVREGEYPPPPPRQRHLLATLRLWFADCFTHSYYWKYYAVYCCFNWAFVPFNTLLIVYAQRALNMSTTEFGQRTGNAMIIQLPIFFLLGPVVDKFHPLRVGVFGFAAMLVAGVGGFFCAAPGAPFTTWAFAAFASIAIFRASLVTLGPRLLPRTRYGQFCAAAMMIVESGMIVLSWVCGKMMDQFGERFLWLWFAGSAALGILAISLLYRAWLRQGGDANYLPPGDFDTASPCNVKQSS